MLIRERGLLPSRVCWSCPVRHQIRIVWRNTAKHICQLKNDNGRYFWQTNIERGQPSLLLGYPVLAEPHAPR